MCWLTHSETISYQTITCHPRADAPWKGRVSPTVTEGVNEVNQEVREIAYFEY